MENFKNLIERTAENEMSMKWIEFEFEFGIWKCLRVESVVSDVVEIVGFGDFAAAAGAAAGNGEDSECEQDQNDEREHHQRRQDQRRRRRRFTGLHAWVPGLHHCRFSLSWNRMCLSHKKIEPKNENENESEWKRKRENGVWQSK